MSKFLVQVRRGNLDKWLCKRKTRDKICPSSLSKFLVQVLVQVQVPPENSRTLIFSSSGCLVIKKSGISLRAGAPRFQAGPDSRQAPIPTSWPRAETRTWTRTWTRNLDKFYHVFSSCRATCPSSPGELGQGTWTTAGCRVTSLSITPRFQAGPNSVCLAPAETRTWTRTWTRNLDKFYHVCFPLTEPLVQVRPGNLDKKLGQLQAAVLQALLVLRPDSKQAPVPTSCAQGGNPNLDKNLDKELGQVLSRVFLLQSHLPSSSGELGQGTWTTAGCRVTSSLSIPPRFRQAPIPLPHLSL